MPPPSLTRPLAERSVEGADSGRDRSNQTKNILGTIETCIPALRRYSAALVRDRDKADDAVRHCLLQALDRLHTMRADGDVKPRLFAILHQILAKTMRRQRFRSVTGAMTAQYPNETGYKPERKEAGRQDDLLRGLDHLPERQRSVVLLISVENLTYTETATVLGISSRTVMEQLANGRERLRQTNAGLSPESGIIA